MHNELYARWRRTVAGVILHSLCVAVCPVLVASAQQRNIVYMGVPDFLKHDWELVAGPDSTGRISATTGHVMTGNQIIMISPMSHPRVAGDFSELTVDTVLQLNLRGGDRSNGGYLTVFDLKSSKGEALLYPATDFWTISIRFSPERRYVSYIGLLMDHRQSLESLGMLEAQIEVHRKLLEREYESLAKGLTP